MNFRPLATGSDGKVSVMGPKSGPAKGSRSASSPVFGSSVVGDLRQEVENISEEGEQAC